MRCITTSQFNGHGDARSRGLHPVSRGVVSGKSLATPHRLPGLGRRRSGSSGRSSTSAPTQVCTGGRTPQTERVNEPRSPLDAHPAQGQCRRPPDRRPGPVDRVLCGAGWELSPASTAAMSLFKTAGSLLLVCTDELLTELWRPRGGRRPGGPADRRSRLVHSRGHRRRGRRRATGGGPSRRGRGQACRSHPAGGSYGFFADPDGHVWEVIHHPLYQLGTDGRPEIP